MKKKGYYRSGLFIKTPYYGIRYNQSKAFLSDKPLGLQVLINFLGTMMWININQEWLLSSYNTERSIKC